MTESLISRALELKIKIATAESLTGGALCARLIDTPGASAVVLGGQVAYIDQLKAQLLGVSSALMQEQSAVDPEVAAQMAEGARLKFAKAAGIEEQTVLAVATTGVAGPEPVGIHPAGVVYIAVSDRLGVAVYAENFSGDRSAIRNQSVDRALAIIGEHLGRLSGS